MEIDLIREICGIMDNTWGTTGERDGHELLAKGP
jgi:hypothetical protein